ncbi:tetratricopeptide repeat protein [Bacteroidota bacterium]
MDQLLKKLPEIKNTQVLKRNVEEIQRFYKQSLKVYTEHPVAWNNLGYIYFTFYSDYSKAILHFNNAIKFDPKYVDAYYHLGLCYESLNDTVQAIHHYKKTIVLDPSYINAYAKLSNLYAISGDFNKAIKVNRRIIEIDPLSDIPYMNLGSYALMQYDTINAILYFEKALEVAPGNFRLAYLLEDYYATHNNINKANYYKNLGYSAQLKAKTDKRK